jgi:hypothetical protein
MISSKFMALIYIKRVDTDPINKARIRNTAQKTCYRAGAVSFLVEPERFVMWILLVLRPLCVDLSVAETHQFYPAPGENFDAAPALTLLQYISCRKFLNGIKVNLRFNFLISSYSV